MKRWRILILLGILVSVSIAALSGILREPSDFTGKWYYAEDMSAYLFHNGIIISEKHHISTEEDEIFSGAYSFGKDRIVLFFIGTDGVEHVRELRIVSDSDGDRLCEIENEMTVFYRKKKTVRINE